MWSKDDHGFVHLGTFRAVRSTSGKVWILFTPSGKKKKQKTVPGVPRMEWTRQMGTGFRKKYW